MATLTYTLYRGKEKVGKVVARKGEATHLYGVELNFNAPQKEIVSGEDRAVFAGQK